MSAVAKSVRPLVSSVRRVPRSFFRSISILRPPNVEEFPTQTSEDVIKNLSEAVIGGPVIYDPKTFIEGRKKLGHLLPSSQDELPPRRMLDSFDQASIPLASTKNPKLRDRYLTHFGGVRVGRLLEDMDVFAVHLVFKHILNPKQPKDNPQSPFSIVTALVDRIDFKNTITAFHDIKMMGHVTWVGKSSVESTLELYQFRDDKWIHVTDATFVMVVRDPVNKCSSFVNRFVVDSLDEKEIFERGERNKISRLSTASDSLFQHPPSEEEKSLIHDFFIQTVDHKALSFKARVLPPNSVWMENAKLKNILICQPENRNRFNKIFGGFLMRSAFELAWANTYVYSGRRPFIEHMDDISFKKPVDIGSLLYFNSQICYTEGNFIQTRVSAEVLDPSNGELSLSNVFQYTFRIEGEPAPNIIPKTYHEAMMYLEARRHFLVSTKSH